MVCALSFSCSKSTYLDSRYDYSLVIPSSLDDLRQLLDNARVMNGINGFGAIPVLSEVASDDYYLTDEVFDRRTEQCKKLYLWDSAPFSGTGEILDWAYPYRAVYYANTVLEHLGKVPATDPALADELRGSALFHRSFAFYHLAQVFAPPYAEHHLSETAIYLRQGSDINEPLRLASVQETYGRILADLEASTPLLPLSATYKTRPSRAAAYALLARIHVSMRSYPEALAYADSCLALTDVLMDYNDLVPQATFPVPRFNAEVIFHSMMNFRHAGQETIHAFGNTMVDAGLYNEYQVHDLRKDVFFRPYGDGFTFGGSYDGTQYLFGGLATDEVYLIRAECLARAGRWQEGMGVLNALLETRYERETYSPLVAGSKESALESVLMERRKQLVFRGVRWSDLRRFHLEGMPQALSRRIGDANHPLPDNRQPFTFPHPPKF